MVTGSPEALKILIGCDVMSTELDYINTSLVILSHQVLKAEEFILLCENHRQATLVQASEPH